MTSAQPTKQDSPSAFHEARHFELFRLAYDRCVAAPFDGGKLIVEFDDALAVGREDLRHDSGHARSPTA